jgi:hypothetical protein
MTDDELLRFMATSSDNVEFPPEFWSGNPLVPMIRLLAREVLRLKEAHDERCYAA